MIRPPRLFSPNSFATISLAFSQYGNVLSIADFPLTVNFTKRVLLSSPVIILINPSWDEPHHVIYLNRTMGALEIPIGTYHRSISGKEGSIVLNQPKRDKFFDPSKEFIPQKLDKEILIKARRSAPIYWIWENDQIKRVRFNPLKRKVKTLI